MSFSDYLLVWRDFLSCSQKEEGPTKHHHLHTQFLTVSFFFLCYLLVCKGETLLRDLKKRLLETLMILKSRNFDINAGKLTLVELTTPLIHPSIPNNLLHPLLMRTKSWLSSPGTLYLSRRRSEFFCIQETADSAQRRCQHSGLVVDNKQAPLSPKHKLFLQCKKKRRKKSTTYTSYSVVVLHRQKKGGWLVGSTF